MDNNPSLKLKFYYSHVLSAGYDDSPKTSHPDTMTDVIERFLDPLGLPKDSKILDLGCGSGDFLDDMRTRGYTDVTGITLNRDDHTACEDKGHTSLRYKDTNFLDDRDESVDLLFARRSLERTPFPYITLLEYNRVLRPQRHLYVEVSDPRCDIANKNKKDLYSLMDRDMWISLLHRAGFDVDWHECEVPFHEGDDPTPKMERYHAFLCHRARPMDIK